MMFDASQYDEYVRVGPVRTRFRTAGDGPALILIHGIGGALEDWGPNVGALAARHRVFALDLVGFGRTDKPDAFYTLEFLAQFVRDFMDALSIERASLVGLSLGGGAALRFAIDFPARLERLVLVAAGGLGAELTPFLRWATLPVVGEIAMIPSRAAFVRGLKEVVHDPAALSPEWTEARLALAREPGAARAFLATLRTQATVRGIRSEVYRPLLDGLARVAAPTMIVWGREDRILPVIHAEAGARRLPSAKVRIFEKCGHFPQLEKPREFNELVLEFLAAEKPALV